MARIPEVIESASKIGMHATVVGRYRTCRIYPCKDGSYCRVTSNGSKHGRRYADFATYEAAIAAAFAWGNRKARAMTIGG